MTTNDVCSHRFKFHCVAHVLIDVVNIFSLCNSLAKMPPPQIISKCYHCQIFFLVMGINPRAKRFIDNLKEHGWEDKTVCVSVCVKNVHYQLEPIWNTSPSVGIPFVQLSISSEIWMNRSRKKNFGIRVAELNIDFDKLSPCPGYIDQTKWNFAITLLSFFLTIKLGYARNSINLNNLLFIF